MTGILSTAQGRRIAHDRLPGRSPGVVFLHGFTSDMTGTKAAHLAAWAQRTGRAFLRFDCSGHGASSGRLTDGSVTDWADDAAAAIGALTEGPQVLVGSSMGGWIGLLLAARRKVPVLGFIGIAAAPDFTRAMHDNMSGPERARLATEGRGLTPDGATGDLAEVWSRLIDDRAALLFDKPLSLPFPVRLLHGTADADVPVMTALRIADHADCPDLRVTIIKGADHRFSTPDCLALVETAVAEVLVRSECRAAAGGEATGPDAVAGQSSSGRGHV